MLNLGLKITVDGAEAAQRQIAGVEKAVHDVERASTPATEALAEASDAIAGLGTEAATAERGVKSVAREVQTFSGLLKTTATEGAAAASLGVTAFGAAVAGAGLALTAFVALGIQSANFWAKQSGLANDHAAAVDRASLAWDNFRLHLGQAVLGARGDSGALFDYLAKTLDYLAPKAAALALALKDIATPDIARAASMLAANGPGVNTASFYFDAQGNRVQSASARLAESQRLAAVRMADRDFSPLPPERATQRQSEAEAEQKRLASEAAAEQKRAIAEATAAEKVRTAELKKAAAAQSRWTIAVNEATLTQHTNTALAVLAGTGGLNAFGFQRNAMGSSSLTPEEMDLIHLQDLQGGSVPMMGTPQSIASMGFLSQPQKPSTLTALLSKMPQTVLAAITGGGNVGQAIGGLAGGTLGTIGGSLASSAIGGTLGATVGSAIPIVGTILGGLAGKALGGLFGPSKNAVADKNATGDIGKLQSQLLDTYGSLSNIKAMGDMVGVSLAEAWGDKSVKGLEHFKGLMDEFQTKQDRLQSALDKYSLTWEDLGKSSKEFFLNTEAQGLLQDFTLLKTAGVDENTLLQHMAASWSSLTQEATRNSLMIPLAMQPILQQLVDMGLLLDEAGNKIADLSGLFASIDVPTITIPVQYDIQGPDMPTFSPNDLSAASGGYIGHNGVLYRGFGGFVPRGTDTVPAMLTPGEFVLNRSAVDRIGVGRLHAMNSGSGGTSVTLNVDARHGMWDNPAKTQQFADKVGDLLMKRIRTNTRWTAH